ncbi:ATP-dependent Clp protease proteolytic subunit 6, chloroplastic [Morella rubra]|uniref:ATP-dependent Clp protease proteolytic subunit n=1 Tax=Morella rubra TaxID=262757 RepID=A0A6A1V3N4_9ROSI|nr:ATP-dependent Clp protease proteolytic subunit 6, chloroplastic [Morella rubra]
MVASAITARLSFSIAPFNRTSSIPLLSHRNSRGTIVSALPSPYRDSLSSGLSRKTYGQPCKREEKDLHDARTSYGAIEARKGNPPVMPAVMTPGGPMDLSSVLFRNRIIFIGQPITSQVAQRVISQLVTLATIDEDADILVYLNCPGGSTYSVLAIYDCMSWLVLISRNPGHGPVRVGKENILDTGDGCIRLAFKDEILLNDSIARIKPKVGTVCFGVAASQGALLLAGGEKGMRYSMPNARIMIHQPQSGCGGHVEDKIDKMYAAFTGQPLEKVQQYTERDRFLSVSEAMEFGLIDGILETEY